jgi:mono/diheme cytochrome c family protein
VTSFLLSLLLSFLIATGPSVSPRPGGAVRGSELPIDLVWMAGPAQDATPTKPAPALTPRLRARGARLYADRCAACHGQRGDGRGSFSARLTMPATDFTRGVFKLRSTPSGSLPTDRDLFVTLTRGMHGTPMFPWPRLSEEDRWALVAKVKSFSPRFRQEQPAPTLVVPRAPSESAALRASGQRLYVLHRCGACHGETGAGDGPAVVTYQEGAAERFVRMRNLAAGRFIRGTALEDIYLTLLTGFDGTPMGSYEALPPEDLWALASYVRNLIRAWPVQQDGSRGDRAEKNAAGL